MIKNYIKTAWRSIVKRKFYSILNISGLALAISCCILIYLYTSYQLSFDTYHKRAGNIFRVVYELHLDKTEYNKGGSIAVYDALRTQFAYVNQAAVSVSGQSFIVNVTGNTAKRFKEEKNIAFTNAAWFNMFSYKWLAGDAAQLNEPNTAVLTKKQAIKYFGDADPTGKILTINGQQVKVIGVLADGPYNTDLRSDVYLSFLSIKPLLPKTDKSFFTDWGYLNTTNNVFVELGNPNQRAAVEQQLAPMVSKHLGDGGKYFKFKLLPLKEQHFDPRYEGKVQKSLLVTLVAIGLLILLIAGINYINLIIAGQTRRSVEIGTRKVLGSSAMQLFIQFMTESFLNSFIAIMVAFGVVLLTLPGVNALLFTENPIHILSYTNLGLFLGCILIIIIIGTGIYPALLLSRVNIFKALKNNLGNLQAGTNRKILVMLQNVVAQALIICTLIIVMQVQFLKNTDKGFSRKFVVTVPVGDVPETQKELLRERLNTIPGVQSLTYCNNPPSSDSHRGATFKFSDRAWEKWPVRFAIGDSAYCKTFGLQLVAGRNIRENPPVPEYLINETMAAMLHVKSNADIIGKNLVPGDVKGIIVGIVKDFNVRSLVEPIEPSVVLENKFLQTNLAIKLSGRGTQATLDAIKTAYLHTFPEQVFTYQFVDDEIADLYKTQVLQQKLIWAASGIAIFISSLGLLGLISLITLHRTKEIGIRKVLGASVSQINMLLSKEFLVIVLLAMVISSPLAWWVMHQWLQGFAYRIEVQWWVFAVAGILAILIAFVTISFQTIKAAIANPVKSLRNE